VPAIEDRPLTEVADGVHVATSAVYATTSTVLLGDGGRCLVIDPAVTAAEVAGLSATLRRRGWRPVAVWSTHPHWDHLLDGPGLDGAPRWAATAPGVGWRERARAQRDADPEAAGAGDVTTIAPVPFPGASAGGGVLDWDGPEVRVLTHDAHCAGSSVLAAVDARVLVAGDLLSDVEVPLLDGPVDGYRAVLDRLGSLVTRYGLSVVVPGHGTIGDPVVRLAADRVYLDRLGEPEPADPRLGDAAPDWLRAADRAQRGV
jgi:hydroxyacylglutathione hydrolase